VTVSGRARAAVVAGATAAVLALGLAGGIAIAPAVTGTPPAASPAPGAVDVGFSQDMIVHHEQAVLMAQLARGRTTDPHVGALAAGVEGNQLLEIGQMRGFLSLWDAPVLPSGPPMTWMAHDGHRLASTAMPGMATQDELSSLAAASGTEADVLLLQLLLRHHDGGIAMLHAAADRAALPAVRNLAARMAYDQAEESRVIRQLLTAHRAQPMPPSGS
jgi:uncharacterized protein (DUF305 family)